MLSRTQSARRCSRPCGGRWCSTSAECSMIKSAHYSSNAQATRNAQCLSNAQRSVLTQLSRRRRRLLRPRRHETIDGGLILGERESTHRQSFFGAPSMGCSGNAETMRGVSRTTGAACATERLGGRRLCFNVRGVGCRCQFAQPLHVGCTVAALNGAGKRFRAAESCRSQPDCCM
jgi:hypothetical protein